VSTDPFFSTVALGQFYENLIRDALKSKAPLDYKQWGFVAVRLVDNKYEKGIAPPFKCRFDGVVYYTLYLPFFKFLIKMDRQAAPQTFWGCRFSSDNGTVCLRLPFDDSPERAYLGKVAAALRERENT
jgi:hypothetical protein